MITTASASTLAYRGSVLSNNASSATYENIKFANNVCSGVLSSATVAFTNGSGMQIQAVAR